VFGTGALPVAHLDTVWGCTAAQDRQFDLPETGKFERPVEVILSERRRRLQQENPGRRFDRDHRNLTQTIT
jgi:hypothetical protein